VFGSPADGIPHLLVGNSGDSPTPRRTIERHLARDRRQRATTGGT
jgi:hypothetical protein